MCKDVVEVLIGSGFDFDKIGADLEKYTTIQKYLYACNEGNIWENIET